MKPLITVIIPFYKAEKYIGRCLKSVLRQTYENLEIILVNDASPDDSLSICRKFEQRDSRIRIVTQPQNAGVDKARFRGIQEAAGNLLMFVDADDYLPSHSVELLYEAMERTGADVVEGGTNRVADNLGLIRKRVTQDYLEVSRPQLFEDYYISFFGVNILSVTLWGKLYKKFLFEEEKLKPTGYKMGEDLMLNMSLFPNIRKYVRIPNIVYNYRMGGLTSGYNPTLYSDLKEQYYVKLRMIERYGYAKALRTTKVEMCNVLFSNVVQQIRWRVGNVNDFLKNEDENGFIGEITRGIEYSPKHFECLKTRNFEGFVALATEQANSKKYLRKAIIVLSPLLKWI